ncbi:MAG: hypothetical protein KatS3mg053_3396 [Candidatus Roseilinea sp.]|nr:MAG: hypothetical protein KatS3mg053_3396 [Candidatus Roseilinea sp.]
MNFESVNETDRPTDAVQSEIGGAVAETPSVVHELPLSEGARELETLIEEQPVEPTVGEPVASEAEATPAAPQAEMPSFATTEAPSASDASESPMVDGSVQVEQPAESPTPVASSAESQAEPVVESDESASAEKVVQPPADEPSIVEAAASGTVEAEEEELVIRLPKRRSKSAKSDKPKTPRKSAKKAEKLPDPGDGTGYEAPYVPEGVESPDEPQWYAIHCYSGYENKVKHNLEQRIETMGMADKIFEVVVPTEDEIEVRDGKRRTVERRVFPGYVMVRMKMSEDSWHVVRNTPGVTRFVGMGNRPQPLSPQEVNQILRRMEAEAPKIKVNFRVGQKVRITDGPFADFMGLVDKIDTERAKVTVLVSFFGRETPVELDFLQVEKM